MEDESLCGVATQSCDVHSYSPSFHSDRVDCDIEIDTDVYTLSAQFLHHECKRAHAIISAVEGTNLSRLGVSIKDNSTKPQRKPALSISSSRRC
jgi:hypothetical protein